jgi:DNA topoisomerase-1
VTEEVPKPPRASLPKGWEPEEMDLEKALMLLSLPRKVGDHPEDGEPVEAGIGRYGPYVRSTAGSTPISGGGRGVHRRDEPRGGVDRGQGRRRPGGRGAAAAAAAELGEHPEEGGR